MVYYQELNLSKSIVLLELITVLILPTYKHTKTVMNLFGLTSLTKKEKVTFGLHLNYSVLEGVLAGIIALNEFVFVKSLLGSGIQASMLFQFGTLVFILLIFFNGLLSSIKNRKRLLRITALATRLPLFLLLFFPRDKEALSGDSIFHLIFLGIFLIYYLASPIILPNINQLLKNGYTHQNFGKLFSLASTANRVVMMITTFAYGLLLDHNPFFFAYAFPVAGALGIGSLFFLSRIPFSVQLQHKPYQGIFKEMKSSVSQMLHILKTNTPFRHFQTGFMFYGFGFMGSFTVIILFFEQALALNYSSVAFYRNSYNLLAIGMMPLFGRLVGLWDPRRFAGLSFLSMALFLASLILTYYHPYHFEVFNIRIYFALIAYIVFHGVFAATMALSWSIGSAYFCAAEEAGNYQSVHLSLTAMRSIFAPVLGVLFYELWGYVAAFSIAIVMLLIGSFIMWVSEKRNPLKKTITDINTELQ